MQLAKLYFSLLGRGKNKKGIWIERKYEKETEREKEKEWETERARVRDKKKEKEWNRIGENI